MEEWEPLWYASVVPADAPFSHTTTHIKVAINLLSMKPSLLQMSFAVKMLIEHMGAHSPLKQYSTLPSELELPLLRWTSPLAQFEALKIAEEWHNSMNIFKAITKFTATYSCLWVCKQHQVNCSSFDCCIQFQHTLTNHYHGLSMSNSSGWNYSSHNIFQHYV